ncbi:MAG TPA: beta galactosidase jelly roll domain-containing protein [Anaerohalosphaeraceae bacterium]|nr:beta galactosidase jelly roll domain-containing protein [Anaerohalosphaeraceae bacterium]HPC65169.1 beta galactosidase jelly roll domain-containing protein [Anaerohalosphaeraceae bacterium]HPO69893.1 beta galactosidase jelly roll domain-containing protein [Anaerohalosphaeraceae bacterium]HRS71918.1 beta galactosidase jelly roll domain-containing protein [Anaerohalosphaeraceae bacterium]HRV20596.1 beta galactosidase jelly roll domain-containing protein [Anaerohalosphaeraceae bacterium]
MEAKTQVLFLLLSCSLFAAAWQPAQAPLMTQWAEDVTPNNVWPEYPRPHMVRQNWQNLNGLWDYAVVSQDAPKPDSWDGKILVPFCIESALSGVMKKVQPSQSLWYRRTFQSSLDKSSKRLLLHFGAVDWQAAVWVNGKQVGRHTGGYDPFTFDITDAVVDGQNELVVRVWDPTDTGSQPKGKQVLRPGGIMYTAVTGIWQTVWLETVPSLYIQSLKIVPDVDRSVVQITVSASNTAEAAITVKDNGRTAAQAQGKTGQPIEVKLEACKLWSPDSPHLYDLEISLMDASGAADRVSSYFGMRKIEVKKDENGINRLFLNNKVLFQYGPLDQGWWPDGLYTPASQAAMEYDIVMTKKFGMNMARKHVKYECARWYYLCDKLGLLVWQDMPSGDTGRDEESKSNFRTELKAMVDALHNFPCIVMWIPFNEGWGQHDTEEIVQWMQNYDPTRPINEASGWHDRGSGDVSDMHNYPGPGVRPAEDKRVCVLGEFGGLGLPIEGHLWQPDRNWGYVSYKNTEELTDAYVGLLTAMRPLIAQGLSAAVYTQTSDVEIEINGLMTYDRKVVKMDLGRCAEAAAKLYRRPPAVKTLVETSQQQRQTWRYTTQSPSNNWVETAFDDTSWRTGRGGFGTSGTPGAVVGTVWNTSDIWMRRTFELDTVPAQGDLLLVIHHDEDAQVYLNGKQIKTLSGYITNYTFAPLSPDALKLLKTGVNTLAVHCRQTSGGQYIDVGLSLLLD